MDTNFMQQYEAAVTASLPLLSRVAIKRVDYSERMSEETMCYACDVWLDGTKVGEARNDGHGGETHVRWLSPEAIAEFRIELAAAQGAEPAGILMFGFVDAVDHLMEQWVEARRLKETIRKLHRRGRHVIICGDMILSAPADKMPVIPQIGDKVNGRVVTEVHAFGGVK